MAVRQVLANTICSADRTYMSNMNLLWCLRVPWVLWFSMSLALGEKCNSVQTFSTEWFCSDTSNPGCAANLEDCGQDVAVAFQYLQNCVLMPGEGILTTAQSGNYTSSLAPLARMVVCGSAVPCTQQSPFELETMEVYSGAVGSFLYYCGALWSERRSMGDLHWIQQQWLAVVGSYKPEDPGDQLVMPSSYVYALLNFTDAIIPVGIVNLYYAMGMLTEITQEIIVKDTKLDWYGIHTYFVSRMSLVDKTYISIPFSGALLALHYRTDVFAQANLTVPTSWYDLVYVANILNGTDMDGDGNPDYGFCLDDGNGCMNFNLLMNIWGTFVQTKPGTTGGMVYDVTTGTFLLNTTAMMATLQLLSTLNMYSPSRDLARKDTCNIYDTTFLEGRCAMTFAPAHMLKASFSNNSHVQGKVAISLTPGSSRVMDHATLSWEDCTADICPYADASVLQHDGSVVLVNRVPVMCDTSLALVVSNASWKSAFDRMQSLRYVSHLGSGEVTSAIMSQPDSDIGPVRYDQLDINTALPYWVTAGYTESSALNFLQVSNDHINHPNAMSLDDALHNQGSMPKQTFYMLTYFRYMMMDASRRVVGGWATPLETYEQLGYVTAQLLNGTDLATVLLQLQNQAARNQPPLRQPPGSHSKERRPSPSSELGAWFPITITFCVVGVVVAIVALGLAAYSLRRYMRRLGLLGRVLAPGVGPKSTLLVTDIQDSTALWERQPSLVMDAALKTHHQCLRRLMVAHRGYESATEGDSFILAFHCPLDALMFAVEAQVALMEADWPQDLYADQLCAPTFVDDSDVQFSMRHVGVTCVSDDTNEPGTQSHSHSKAPIAASANSVVKGESISLKFIGRWLSVGLPAGESESVSSYEPSLLKEMLGHIFPVASDPIQHHEGRKLVGTHAAQHLIFKGLRVRMGFHSGISSGSDVLANKASARTTYRGLPLRLAKAVSDAAAGGMVLLSRDAQVLLPRADKATEHIKVWYMGLWRLGDGDLPLVHLFQSFVRPLLPRIPHLVSLRGAVQLGGGVLEAPVGHATLTHLQVVGVDVLLAWDKSEAELALQAMYSCTATLLVKHKGCLVEAGPSGIMVAAFTSPSTAVTWPLECMHQLTQLSWSSSLLRHELCEEMHFEFGTPKREFVFRGPRLRCGVHAGKLKGQLDCTSGKLVYKGKMVRHTQNIAGTASSNQVLCSTAVVDAVMEEQSEDGKNIVFVPRAKQVVSGRETLQVFECMLRKELPSCTALNRDELEAMSMAQLSRQAANLALKSSSLVNREMSVHSTALYKVLQNSKVAKSEAAKPAVDPRINEEEEENPCQPHGLVGG